MFFLFLILGVIVFVFILGAVIAFLPSKTLQGLEESVFGKKEKNCLEQPHSDTSEASTESKQPESSVSKNLDDIKLH